MDIASLTINQHFNRFSDVLPCKDLMRTCKRIELLVLVDDTRVRLRRGSNDYINANYVQVPSANRKYIVTQVSDGRLREDSGFNGIVGTIIEYYQSFLANDLGRK